MGSLSRLCAFVVVLAALAGGASGQVPGWDPRWPSVESMPQGHDPALVREFRERSAQIARNPDDVVALNRRGYVCSELSRSGLYRVFWRWLAAKDLEQVVKLDPNNFYAWHNYGDLNYMSGDFWMMNDHSNAARAARAFSRAIAINPKSARSYMGRGWVYLTMDDPQRADADFRQALALHPSLRPSLQAEVRNVQERKSPEAAARGTLHQVGRYYVERSATGDADCKRYVGTWTQGECRISMALYPGPDQPWEGHK